MSAIITEDPVKVIDKETASEDHNLGGQSFNNVDRSELLNPGELQALVNGQETIVSAVKALDQCFEPNVGTCQPDLSVAQVTLQTLADLGVVSPSNTTFNDDLNRTVAELIKDPAYMEQLNWHLKDIEEQEGLDPDFSGSLA